jgi:hypothetical protein
VDEAEKRGEGELAAGWNGEALEIEQLVLFLKSQNRSNKINIF